MTIWGAGYGATVVACMANDSSAILWMGVETVFKKNLKERGWGYDFKDWSLHAESQYTTFDSIICSASIIGCSKKREIKNYVQNILPLRTLRMLYNWEIRGTWVGNHAQNVGRAALVWPLCGSAPITFLSLDREGKDRFQGWVSAASLAAFTVGLSVSGSL